MLKSDANKVKRILIVDDHPLMRGGMASLLAADESVEVVAGAGTVRAAMALIAEREPDLVVVDLRLPDGSGLELIKDALARWPEMRFLVVSMHDEKLYAERVLRAGGRGYIMKEAASEKLLQAIHQVLDGEVYVSEKMTQSIVNLVSKQRLSGEAEVDSPLKILTDRELEVFELIGSGLATRKIAERLTIGIKTAETHTANLKTKLRMADRNELMSFAVRWLAEQ